MLEMAINNVEMGSELDRVHILTCCGMQEVCSPPIVGMRASSI